MSTYRIVSSIALFVVAVMSTPASAQQQDRRHGFWIGGAIGVGINTATASDQEHHGGGAGFIRAGGAPSGHVVLGTELIGWVTERDSVTTARGNVHAFVQYYPSRTGGLFFKGGLGASGLSVSVPVDPGTLVTNTNGFGLTLGGGYEFPVSAIASLTANFDWVFQAFDNPEIGSESSSLFLLTVGITFPRIG